MDSSFKIESKLKQLELKSRELGFDGFGVARPGITQAIERFEEWLRLNYDGEMAYMSRGAAKRGDLNKVLPGVQSILCLRSNYFPEEKDLTYLENHDEGDISLYALDKDYHDIILPRLKELELYLQNEFPGCQTKVYVDTGPVLEKPLAQQAGLGWIGKHTNLITEGVGSWFFLSEILADVWLPESNPAVDRCGTCRECIDICPTQAIVAPYVLDSRKCISYLNIELKGVIPREFRKAIGNRVYGCDDCQIVCPWNSFAVTTAETAYLDKGNTKALMEWIRLDDDGFRARFRKSPIKRIKRRGFLRNVAVALGNSNDPVAVPALVQVLNDPEPLIRTHVIWALGELMGPAKALDLVKTHLANEKHEWVQQEIEELGKAV